MTDIWDMDSCLHCRVPIRYIDGEGWVDEWNEFYCEVDHPEGHSPRGWDAPED